MFHVSTVVIIYCHLCTSIYTRVYESVHICDHCIHFALSIFFESKKSNQLQSKPLKKKMHPCSHKQNAVGSTLPSVHHIENEILGASYFCNISGGLSVIYWYRRKKKKLSSVEIFASHHHTAYPPLPI